MTDLEDLTDKYKNKPEQLKHILETTYKFVCKVRKVTLYADPEYTQETILEMQQERKRELSIATEHTRKRANVDNKKIKRNQNKPSRWRTTNRSNWQKREKHL